MVQITNHFERALVLLAAQFQENVAGTGITNFQKLIKVIIQQIQELDDVNWELKNQRSLFTAVGEQLDGLGQILGLPRNPGESDESYRQRLLFQTFINSSQGTPEDAIRALKESTAATSVWYHEYYPGAFQMATDGQQFPDPPNSLVTLIQSVSPAAIQYTPITATYGSPVPFIFGSDPVTDILQVTDPADPSLLVDFEVDTGLGTFLLEVNAGRVPFTATQGHFAEVNLDGSIDISGAGQLAEVITINGNTPLPNP